MIDDTCPDCGEVGEETLYCIICDTDVMEGCFCSDYEWWSIYKCDNCGAIWDPF